MLVDRGRSLTLGFARFPARVCLARRVLQGRQWNLTGEMRKVVMRRKLAWTRKRVQEGLSYRLRTFGGGRWASLCRPTSISFLLTELCNARCVHCDIWKNRGKEDSPTVEQWKAVLCDLRNWLGPVQITFGGGEALLKPFTTDLIAFGSSIGLFVELLTHGYWEDPTKMEKVALSNPWRVTISLDGIGEVHDKVRGREKFFQRTSKSIETLTRIRKEKKLDFGIRLKTVVMSHNVDELGKIAEFATQDGMDVFYQPIEQNYNTEEDPSWYKHSDNWPKDTAKITTSIKHLIQLKKRGFHIGNSYEQLQVMIPYFQSPDALRLATQYHSAHEGRPLCSALTTIEFRANGDVLSCAGKKAVGNIKGTPIPEIWEKRPRWWEGGCCLERSTGSEQKDFVPAETIHTAV